MLTNRRGTEDVTLMEAEGRGSLNEVSEVEWPHGGYGSHGGGGSGLIE